MKETSKILILLLSTYLVTPTFAQDWWETASFYQIYPQSFKDADGNGLGDLKGITSKLDYLQDLGVTAVWLTPIFEATSHGYDITNFKEIDPQYGTLQDFKDLADKVHEKGMKIILDFVPNHTSEFHPWFIASATGEGPYKDYYVWHDGLPDPTDSSKTIPPNNWNVIGQGSAWHFHPTLKKWYIGQFHANMPDLNFWEPRVHEEMESILKHWLDLGLDGFRIDAITHAYEDKNLSDEPLSGRNDVPENDYGYLDHIYTADQQETFEMVYSWRKFLDDYTTANGGDTRIIMTESYSAVDKIMKYYGNDTYPGAQLPFNFQMINVLNRDSKSKDFVDMIENWFRVIPEGKITNWVIGNHDQSRVASRFGVEKVDIFNALLMMLPGASVTYYAEEIGMENVCVYQNGPSLCNSTHSSNYNDKFVRTPLQWDATTSAGFSTNADTWLPVSADYVTNNIAVQANQERSHLKTYKELLKLRSHEAIKTGKFSIQTINENVFIFKKELEGKDKSVLVLINLNSNVESIKIPTGPAQVTVKSTSANSKYAVGTEIPLELDLEANQHIVAVYTAAAGHMQLSHKLICFGFFTLIYRFVAVFGFFK